MAKRNLSALTEVRPGELKRLKAEAQVEKICSLIGTWHVRTAFRGCWAAPNGGFAEVPAGATLRLLPNGCGDYTARTGSVATMPPLPEREILRHLARGGSDFEALESAAQAPAKKKRENVHAQ